MPRSLREMENVSSAVGGVVLYLPVRSIDSKEGLSFQVSAQHKVTRTPAQSSLISRRDRGNQRRVSILRYRGDDSPMNRNLKLSPQVDVVEVSERPQLYDGYSLFENASNASDEQPSGTLE
jgi:hypothetical protein